MPPNQHLRLVAAVLMAALLLVACPRRDNDQTISAGPRPMPVARGDLIASAMPVVTVAPRPVPPPPTTARHRPPRAARSAPGPRPAPTGDIWWALGDCESGNNPRAIGGGGRYRGAFQFTLGTWHSLGLAGDPIDYSWADQRAAAERLVARSGWGQFPHCARKLGLR